jgi:hypothetical protein
VKWCGGFRVATSATRRSTSSPGTAITHPSRVRPAALLPSAPSLRSPRPVDLHRVAARPRDGGHGQHDFVIFPTLDGGQAFPSGPLVSRTSCPEFMGLISHI